VEFDIQRLGIINLPSAMELTIAVAYACAVALGIIIVCGVVGNTLSFLIWSTGRRCKTMSCGNYFKLIALADIYNLLVSGIPMLLEISPAQIIIYDHYNFLCKFIPFSGHFGVQLSSWTTVCVTIERTLSICNPLQYHNKNPKRRAYSLFAFISVICFILDIFPLLFYEIQELPASDFNTSLNKNFTETVCVVTVERSLVYIIWNMYISFGCFVVVLPPVIIFISNSFTLLRIRQQMHSKHKQSPKQSKHSTSYTFTVLIITIGIINCISTMPIGYLYVQVDYFNTESSPVFFRVAGFLFYLNSATNVILYCLIGTPFRQDLKQLLTCSFGRCNDDEDSDIVPV
jgi:hypothetical protein